MSIKPIVVKSGSVIGTSTLNKKSLAHHARPYRLATDSKYIPVLRIVSQKKDGISIRKGNGLFMPHLDNKYMASLYENNCIDQLCHYIFSTYNDLDYFVERQHLGPRDPIFNGIYTKSGAYHFPEIKELFHKLYYKTLEDTVIKIKNVSLPSWKKKKSDIITFITQAFIRIFHYSFIDNMRTDGRLQRTFENEMEILDYNTVESEYVDDNILANYILDKIKPA